MVKSGPDYFRIIFIKNVENMYLCVVIIYGMVRQQYIQSVTLRRGQLYCWLAHVQLSCKVNIIRQ